MSKSTYGRKATKIRVATSMRRMPNYAPKRVRHKTPAQPIKEKSFFEKVIDLLQEIFC